MKRLLCIQLFYICVLLQSYAVKVVFRFDDPSLIADSTTMRVLHLFNEKQAPIVVAMIPCDSMGSPYQITDSLYLKELQQSNVEIALHGYNHENINQTGEFGSLDFLETYRRISIGKSVLESQLQKEIITFVPPYNIINQYIPQAMLKNGLYILSSDMYDYSYNSNIQYFPESLDYSISQKGFVSAAIDAIDYAFEDELCVLMFHFYDFKDDYVWQRLSNVLDSCILKSNIELHTFTSLYSSGEQSSVHRYRANQLRSGLQK